MNFGSDNLSGASEQVMQFLQDANTELQTPYAGDDWTKQAEQRIQEIFGTDAKVFFVITGTAANCLALASICNPWDSILCHGQAHIINDELTAPEFFTGGARLIGLERATAKLSYQALQEYLANNTPHPPHNAMPGALSLSQLTESGQVYQPEELRALTALAKEHGLAVHMDGARFANAVASLGCHPADITWKAGVDVLCLGATKNGALMAEAVVFFNHELSERFVQLRKRSGHLLSKGRWFGAQFCGWLHDDHWLTLAHHANEQASKLATGISQSDAASLIWPVAGNEMFVRITRQKAQMLADNGAVFNEWFTDILPEDQKLKPDETVLRLVTSFKTQPEDIERFIELLDA